jgi:hypothetical protein
MGIPRLFKLPEHKKFTYRPLFYDPEKEEREERMRELKAEQGIGPEGDFKSRIQRGSMRNYYRKEKAAARQSNIRLILIVVFLLVMTYFLLFR